MHDHYHLSSGWHMYFSLINMKRINKFSSAKTPQIEETSVISHVLPSIIVVIMIGCVCVCAYVCVCACACARTHVRMRVCMCTYVHVCPCMHMAIY